MSEQKSLHIDTGVITQRLRVLSTSTKLKLLVVDDDDIERTLIADRLTLRNFSVTLAENGAAALELMKNDHFPVVLVDWFMPLMDGIEFTEQVRSLGLTDTVIMMLTSKGSIPDYERGYLAGVDDYLTKKVPDVELLARLHTAFAMQSLRAELRETQRDLANARAQLTEAARHHGR